VLRSPTIRDQFGDIADKAEREQLTYRGFHAELFTIVRIPAQLPFYLNAMDSGSAPSRYIRNPESSSN
jgi:hypothetical protein